MFYSHPRPALQSLQQIDGTPRHILPDVGYSRARSPLLHAPRPNVMAHVNKLIKSSIKVINFVFVLNFNDLIKVVSI